MAGIRYRVPLLIGAIAACCVMVAAFGDWAHSGNLSLEGLDRDGEATLAAGIGGLVGVVLFAAWGSFRELWGGLILAAGAVAASLGLDNMAEINRMVRPTDSFTVIEFSVAWGLWLTILGGFALALVAVSLFIALASERRV